MSQNRYAPHETYMKNVVKGGDRYFRIRPKRSAFRQIAYAVFVLVLLVATFASLFIIAEALFPSTQIVK